MRSIHLFSVLALCAASLAAPRLAAQTTFLAFGDSLTHGLGDGSVQCEGLSGGYPPRLRSRLQGQGLESFMRTFGVCGELTSQGVSRIDQVLASNTDADVIVVMEGTNDLSNRNISTESMLFNLRTMAQKSLAAGVRPVLASPIPRAPEAGSNARTGFLASLLAMDTEANDIDFADQYNLLIGINDLYGRFYSDPIHPNSAGYELVAANMVEAALAAATRPAVSAPCSGPITEGDLLLPFYEVDTTDPDSLTTLWSLRNNSEDAVDVEVQYFEPDAPQAFQRCEVFSLAPRAIKTTDIRAVPGLEIGADGVARGYVLFRNLAESGQLQGDTFTITPDESFASGERLVSIATDDPGRELCTTSTLRFLLGGGFSGGTTYRIWFEADAPVSGAEAIVSYAVYSEAGGAPVLEAQLPTEETAFEVDIETLLGPYQGMVDFGAVEFSFDGQVGGRARLGHVSATLDALGAYSVAFEASCGQ